MSDTDADTNVEKNPATAEGMTDSPEETFTKTQLEAIVKDRLKNLKTKYADYDQLKETASQIETQRQAQMTETEKAIEAAKAEGRQEAAKGFATLLAAAEVKAALSGVVEDSDDVVADLDLSKYVNDDGTVNSEAVTALKEKWTKLVGKKSSTQSVGHGRNSGTNTPATPQEKFASAMSDLFSQQ